MNGPALVWFSADLRLADNPALNRALNQRRTVIPVFIWSPNEEFPWAPGGASRWWLHHSLRSLQNALSELGSKLIIRRGPTAETLLAVAQETGAKAALWNRRYEPALISRDRALEDCLRTDGVSVETCPGNLLFEPGTVLNSSGKPFQVFTAFWRACLAAPAPDEPTRALQQHILAPPQWPASLSIADLGLEPVVDWAAGMRETWTPGESGASQELQSFLNQGLKRYAAQRDIPDQRGTSRLSPHLHFGEISARSVWYGGREAASAVSEPYLRQIVWREFSHHLLFHFPATPAEPLHSEFRSFPWRFDEAGFRAWTQGKTGYPLVDAGMRELWHTGWMHNRVRMLAASFLVKHLLIPWREGAAWFWDTLVDADLANNTMGWQWTAGCGADAAPYFRIFNPVLQGEKFDPRGGYVRRWVPELSRLPDAWIHKPWEAPPLVLAEAGVEMGKTYPWPIVEHEAARKRALAALASMRGRF